MSKKNIVLYNLCVCAYINTFVCMFIFGDPRVYPVDYTNNLHTEFLTLKGKFYLIIKPFEERKFRRPNKAQLHINSTFSNIHSIEKIENEHKKNIELTKFNFPT